MEFFATHTHTPSPPHTCSCKDKGNVKMLARVPEQQLPLADAHADAGSFPTAAHELPPKGTDENFQNEISISTRAGKRMLSI